MPPDSRETKLWSSDQEAFPSAGKNTAVVLVPCRAWKCVHAAISGGVNISKAPGVICYDRWVLSEGNKNYIKDWCIMNSVYLSVFYLFLTQWMMSILSKGCKPDNFESHNSLKFSFTNIRGLRLNFVECESSHSIVRLFHLYAWFLILFHLT